MDDMLKEFVVEALDLATNVEEHLLSLERNPDDADTLNALFRSFHTIKGGAGFMNLPAMVAACHLTENLFDGLRTGKVPVTPLAIEAALQASGFVADQLQALSEGTEPAALPAMPEALKDLLNQAIEGKAGAAVGAGALLPETADAAAATVPAADAPASAADDGPDWEALYYAVVPADLAPQRPAVAAPVAAPAAAASDAAAADAGTAAEDFAAVPAAPAPRGKPAAAEGKQASAKDESIRIDAAKLDALLEVAGESVQAANQASVLLEKLMQFKFDGDAATLMTTLAETLGRASRYSTELQRATLSTRMQPVGRLFQKFPRMVRELARDLGKEVELVVEGAETEVDRVVVDSLYDPLVHMLRNSLDHAIESAEARTAAGKPAKATISLKAWQQANSVMIQVADDGKGMDPQVLRNKALAKGLITESMAHSTEEALQLIFLPGFSTKDVASSVSGRGVGMDVVRTAIEKHRGAISIESTMGDGHLFFDPPADRTVDRADHAGAHRRCGAGDPDGRGRTRGAVTGRIRRRRRRAGHARPGPAAAGALARPVARLRGIRRTHRHRHRRAAALYPGGGQSGRHGGNGDQAVDCHERGRHHRHRAFRRGRVGAGAGPVLPDGWLPWSGAPVDCLN